MKIIIVIIIKTVIIIISDWMHIKAYLYTDLILE